MRSRASAAIVLSVLLGLGLATSAWAQAPANPAGVSASAPDGREIKSAVDALRRDPDLGPERTVRTLRWVGRGQPQPDTTMPRWLTWLRDGVGWINQSARVLVWVTIGFAAVLLVTWLVRASSGRSWVAADDGFIAPTHVRELDIRPEALPANIGGAACALWDAGDHRAALALLYRGLLSRLVHEHQVPIKASSTEGDCLALASERLSLPALEYANRLVRTWQQAVYGHRLAATPVVHALCAEFDQSLAATDAVHATPAPAGAA